MGFDRRGDDGERSADGDERCGYLLFAVDGLASDRFIRRDSITECFTHGHRPRPEDHRPVQGRGRVEDHADRDERYPDSDQCPLHAHSVGFDRAGVKAVAA